MFDRHWFRPLRHLLLAFVGTVLVLSAGLAWLGWRTIQQDRALEQQRVRDRLESSADLIAARIRQGLSEIEERLTRFSIVPISGLTEDATEYADSLGEDAVVVVYGDEISASYPDHRLPYSPVVPRSPEAAPADAFAAGEAHEFRARDFASAITYFQRLSESDDERIRAGALLRLARNQRKARLEDAALTTYARLASMGPVPVGGHPADLVARRARCDLLEQLGRDAELRAEAGALDADLQGGRWRLDRAAYLYFSGETERWLAGWAGAPENQTRSREAAMSLAAGAEFVWESWRQRPRDDDVLAGRTSLRLRDRPVLVAWRGTRDRVVALVAGPDFVKQGIVGRLRPLLERQAVGVVLADLEGRPVVSGTVSSGAQTTVRTMAETGLPWTVRAVAADPDDGVTDFGGRRPLVSIGVGLLLLLVVAGIYFTARAMSREIQAVRLQTDLIAAVSHEFRTPLTSLRQFTDLLSEGRALSEQDRAECYGALRRGTRRLSRLVENLLDFARLEAGSRAFDLGPLRARDCVERLVSEFREEASGRGYRVEMKWRGGDVVVQGDEDALGRALWNLLDNAMKYSPDCKTIWVEAMANDTSVEIRVRDKGIGVDDQERSRIFDKFVRGKSVRDNGVKGTGLGLALVRQIVHAHGGRITLASEVGEGSTFSILLPVSE